MPVKKNTKARLLFYNLAFFMLFIFLTELALRFTGIGYDHAAFEPDTVLHHVHKKNYSFINDNPSEKEYSYIAVRYDEWGCVSNPENIYKKTNVAQRIALLGDSYMEGLQVPFEKSVTGILQSESGNTIEVKNFAVGGYSPVIYYLQLQQVFSLYNPHKVILFLYGNDVREDIQYLQKATYRNQKLAGIDGGINPVKYVVIRNSYLIRLIRKYYMQAVFHFTNTGKTYTTENTIEEKPALTTPSTLFLDSIAALCKQHHCQLILSAIPSKYKIQNHQPHDSTDFAMQVKLWAGTKGLTYIDLIPSFEKWYHKTGQLPFYNHDIHFNEYGHALAAAVVNPVLTD